MLSLSLAPPATETWFSRLLAEPVREEIVITQRKGHDRHTGDRDRRHSSSRRMAMCGSHAELGESDMRLTKAPAHVDADEAQRAADRHAIKVERVVRQLRGRSGARPVSLKTRAVSHLVPKPRDKRYTDDKIDISDLNEILEIDPARMTCTAEPGVTFTDLVDATLRHGLVPIIVPELRTITIGGAVAGCSVESMSFKYGGFHDTCLEYELITAAGEVLHCTPDNEHRLIFQMVHGSFGTLGILSRLMFRPALRPRHVRASSDAGRLPGRHLASLEPSAPWILGRQRWCISDVGVERWSFECFAAA
jgi:hypothetical protein